MSPAQPPRPPGRPPAGGGGAPRPQREPEHPAERGQVPGNPQQKAGRYFEIRKGKSAKDEKEREDEAPIMNVALPRSITQEQEQADLKQRLGREELIDIDKRNALVRVKDSVTEPALVRRRSNGLWLLLAVVVIAVVALVADRLHLLQFLHHQ
jgi:hypothetical protein